MKPLSNRILILPTDQDREERTASGIITLRKDIPPSTTGKVVLIGPKITEDIKEGDSVKYGQHSGVPLNWEGKDYLIMRDTEIICVL